MKYHKDLHKNTIKDVKEMSMPKTTNCLQASTRLSVNLRDVNSFE